MKHLKLKVIGAITLMFCITVGSGNACVDVNIAEDTYTVDEGGCVDY